MNAIAKSLFGDFQTIARQSGETEAVRRLRQRIDAGKVDAGACAALAASLLRDGFAGAALPLLDAAIVRLGAVPELRYWRGNALRMNGQFDPAEAELRGVLHDDPAHRDATYSLAHMLREQGRIGAATDAVSSLARHRRERDTILAVLRFLTECASYAQADPIAQSAVAKWPEDALLQALAGEIRLALGAFAEAHEHFLHALDRDPALSSAWLRMAQCQRYERGDDPDLQRFRAAQIDPALARTSRTCAGFALGKALDDLGDCAGATAVLRDANASAALEVRWDARAWQAFVDGRIAAPALAQLTQAPEFVPVFIVGLPRSGTTLLATTLGRQPGVCDRGELHWIAALYEQLHTHGQLNDSDALKRAAHLIATQMRRDDTPVPGWVIDKNPLNFRYLDFICAIFPNARIVHCRRGLRDTALSIWQQHFAHADLAFAYSFEHIAAFVDGYQRLLGHWRATASIPMLDVDYEALVAGTAGELQRIGEFLQLDRASATPIPRPQAITTASVWQARQPVHSRSIERWRRYAAFLPELAALFPD
ncbi:MAG: tetratricopeptide repeat-containing sulfotransferase family protein [Rudaea sp.]